MGLNSSFWVHEVRQGSYTYFSLNDWCLKKVGVIIWWWDCTKLLFLVKILYFLVNILFFLSKFWQHMEHHVYTENSFPQILARHGFFVKSCIHLAREVNWLSGKTRTSSIALLTTVVEHNAKPMNDIQLFPRIDSSYVRSPQINHDFELSADWN